MSSGADREADCAKTIISNGVEHVIVTNHYKGADFILLFGINDANINANNHRVIATSICDSNAIAPVLNVLNAKIGIEYCFVTTLHPWLSYQRLTDSFIHSESFPAAFYNYYPLGRASVNNLIPKSTSAGNVIEDLIPTLAGKVSSFSYRTPLAIVSSSDCSLVMARVTSIEEITTVVKEFSEQCKAPNGRQIVKTGKESLVSSDYIAEQASCTVDMDWLNLDNGRFLKCILWYDNEWGYTSRVADTIDLLSKQKGERRL
ncbi:hypothetical protein FACS1894190_14560 [Spirochaetia bacterium]|nr:hypothetical protein FACS1894190_14560 [Spirochaetia bacterium]